MARSPENRSHASQWRAAGLRGDDGLALIEVLVSAVLLVVIASAALSGMDVSARVSADSRSRAVAATLAETDQEQMRALPVEQLAGYGPPVRSVVVGGVTYTITSRGYPLANADGAEGCTAGGTGVVRVVSTVDWPARRAGRPKVQIESLVNRPANAGSISTGSALLIVRDAAGSPVSPGVNVTLTGSPAYAATTDAEGCAFFPTVAIGARTFTFGRTGWVTPDGVQNVTISGADVAAQQMTARDAVYDRSGTAQVTVETRTNRGTGSTGIANVASSAPSVFLANGDMPGGPRVLIPDASKVVGPLFPFPTAYQVATGECSGNAQLLPADLARAGSAYSSSATIGRGTSTPIRLFQPALDLRVRKSSVNEPGVRVIFTPKSPGCSTKVTRTTDSAGRLADPGLPYGSYDVCADKVYGSTRWTARATAVQNVDVDDVDLTLDLVSGGTICS